jgi:hypothetical protein
MREIPITKILVLLFVLYIALVQIAPQMVDLDLAQSDGGHGYYRGASSFDQKYRPPSLAVAPVLVLPTVAAPVRPLQEVDQNLADLSPHHRLNLVCALLI